MNGIIYMRISPNGKRYIGQTAKTEEARWREHVRESQKKNNPSKYNSPLHTCIRKYGGDSFRVVILECGIKTNDELNEREQYWIKKYHTLISEKQGGLNVAIGGIGHRTFYRDSFQKLYDEGYSVGEISKITGAICSTVSQYLKTTKTENYCRGRKVALSKDPPRPVSCYDINTCEKVYSFCSAADAARKLGVRNNNSTAIFSVINGDRRSAYGYFWKYDDQPIDVIFEQQKKYNHFKSSGKRGWHVVNIETNEVFKSAYAAGVAYNIDSRKIQACCIGKLEIAGGFHWKKQNEDIPTLVVNDKRHKPVICIETNKIYKNTKTASIESGIYINTLRDCLKGRTESVKGYHWEYYKE